MPIVWVRNGREIMDLERQIRQTDIIFPDAKPPTVIIGVRDFGELLERAEDAADVRTLQAMKKKPLHFRKLISAPDLPGNTG